MRGDFSLYGFHFVPVGETNIDIGVFEPEAWVYIRSYLVIRLNDVFDVNVHEVVE